MVAKQLDIFYFETDEKIDLTVMYVFSKEDPDLSKLEYIYDFSNHKRDKIYSSNSRLGKKLNDGINAAILKYDYDYIMNGGSDDLFHPKMIDLYLPYILNKTKIFGLNKLYFYQKGKDPLFFQYYNTPHLVGAGRMIHRSVINAVKYKYTDLYDNDIRRGMDGMSARRMINCGFKQTIIDPDTFPMLVDIKSDENINSFERIVLNAKRRAVKSKTDLLKKHFYVLNYE